jgi:hypothetical protein
VRMSSADEARAYAAVSPSGMDVRRQQGEGRIGRLTRTSGADKVRAESAVSPGHADVRRRQGEGLRDRGVVDVRRDAGEGVRGAEESDKVGIGLAEVGAEEADRVEVELVEVPRAAAQHAGFVQTCG